MFAKKQVKTCLKRKKHRDIHRPRRERERNQNYNTWIDDGDDSVDMVFALF